MEQAISLKLYGTRNSLLHINLFSFSGYWKQKEVAVKVLKSVWGQTTGLFSIYRPIRKLRRFVLCGRLSFDTY